MSAIVYLGTNGIAELQAIDPVFDDYQEVLFGESTMTFQRSMQTAEVNSQIDDTIESFLQRLTPYCLLKPAQKALEWLIYRYMMLKMWIEINNGVKSRKR